MPPSTDIDLKELRDLMIGLREEMRLGFTDTRNEIQRVEVKADNKFAELSSDIKTLDQKLSSDIKALDQKLSSDIKALDQKLSGDIKVLEQTLSGDIKVLDQKVSGQDDRLRNQETRLAQIDTKQGEINIQLAEMKGDLKIVKQPIEFWEFVKSIVLPIVKTKNYKS
jgi:hypothetical protein